MDSNFLKAFNELATEILLVDDNLRILTMNDAAASNGWNFERSARFGVHASGYLITKYGPRLSLASHAALLKEFEATG